MELCELIGECICTKCCSYVRSFSSISELEPDMLISFNFAGKKFLPNCYSIDNDYFFPSKFLNFM